MPFDFTDVNSKWHILRMLSPEESYRAGLCGVRAWETTEQPVIKLEWVTPITEVLPSHVILNIWSCYQILIKLSFFYIETYFLNSFLSSGRYFISIWQYLFKLFFQFLESQINYEFTNLGKKLWGQHFLWYSLTHEKVFVFTSALGVLLCLFSLVFILKSLVGDCAFRVLAWLHWAHSPLHT